jgi:hypothetical protein
VILAEYASGQDPKKCTATTGRVEVCNASYGRNGWLGLAQIWISGSHITKGVAKMNDSYFNMSTYNTSAWRNLVMCQEIAHAFGLDHQDEVHGNVNLGSCMDYTNDPDGGVAYGPDNQYPNVHDFEQLNQIYLHADTTTTVSGATAPSGNNRGGNSPAEWGRPTRNDPDGLPNHYERDLGGGNRVLTHVFWVRASHGNPGGR